MFDPDSHLGRPTPSVPEDRLLADLVVTRKKWIASYHKHESFLENKPDEELPAEEQEAAWQTFEEKYTAEDVD